MRTFSLLLSLALPCCAIGSDEAPLHTIEVTATAYNSVESQTSADPWTGAWGDPLRNGMRVIAVSRDLLDMGLDRGTVVEIDGLPGEWVVLDKMHWRWKQKIDVYMGSDIAAARRFGRRSLTIRWRGEDENAVRPAIADVAAGPPRSLVPETESN